MAAIGVSIYQSVKNKKEQNAPKKPLSLWWLPLIKIFGCLLFSVAMMQQLPYHDYYLLDTFFLPVILLITLTLKALPMGEKRISSGLCFIFGVACAFMVTGATKSQVERRYTEDKAVIPYLCYQDSDKLLDSLDVPRDARILCLYGYAQNGPFIQMGRKGYTMFEDDEELFLTALTWDYDYIVIENNKFMKYFDTRRELLSRLKKIGGNDLITVCKPTNNWVYQAHWQFFYPAH